KPRKPIFTAPLSAFRRMKYARAAKNIAVAKTQVSAPLASKLAFHAFEVGLSYHRHVTGQRCRCLPVAAMRIVAHAAGAVAVHGSDCRCECQGCCLIQ